jgi:hypothetical protein
MPLYLMEGWLRQRETVLTISLSDIPLNSYHQLVCFGGDRSRKYQAAGVDPLWWSPFGE